MKSVEFVIPGIPKGKQRPKVTVQGNYAHAYTPKETVNYENYVKLMYQTSKERAHLEGAIGAVILAIFPIPKSTSKKNIALMRDGKIRHTIEEQSGTSERKPFRVDGYINLLNKYGTAQDNSEAYHYASESQTPDTILMTHYEQNGLFGKIIDIPAQEAVKKGFKLNIADAAVEEYIQKKVRRMKFFTTVEESLKWSRLFGGALAVMIIDDGINDLTKDDPYKGATGVGVLVVKDGKFLVGNRDDNNQVGSPGGHIESWEDAERAAMRETEEEFGITLKNLIPLGMLDNLPQEYGKSFAFLSTDFDGTPLTNTQEMLNGRFTDSQGLQNEVLYEPFKAALNKLFSVLEINAMYSDEESETPQDDDIVEDDAPTDNADSQDDSEASDE